jgi:hypothetical protein
MNIKKKEKNCVCGQCHKRKNKYRNIYTVTICGYHFQLCTECLLTFSGLIKDQCSREFGHREPNEEDIRLEEKLKILFNKKVNSDWNEDCEEELKNLSFETMSNCNKVMYKSIVNW